MMSTWYQILWAKSCLYIQAFFVLGERKGTVHSKATVASRASCPRTRAPAEGAESQLGLSVAYEPEQGASSSQFSQRNHLS